MGLECQASTGTGHSQYWTECRIKPHLDQDGALRAPWAGACAGAPALGGPGRATALTPHPADHQRGLSDRRCCAVSSSSAKLVSCSRLPCQVAPCGCVAARSVSPNPDTAPARQGPAPVGKDGEDQAVSGPLWAACSPSAAGCAFVGVWDPNDRTSRSSSAVPRISVVYRRGQRR